MSEQRHATVHRWNDLPQDHPMPKIARRRLVGVHMMISEVHLAQGFVVPTHQHENEQIAMVVTGRIRFGLGVVDSADYREVELGAGETLHLPPNVPHSAEAIEDTLIYDIFSPVSEATGVDRSDSD